MQMFRQMAMRPLVSVGLPIFVIAVFGGATIRAQQPTLTATTATAAGTPVVGETSAPDTVRLLVGRSTLVDLGAPIARVSLTSADVADALVTSPSQLLVHGKVPGSISMFVWNRAGEVRRFEVAVQRDLTRLGDQVRELFPTEQIQVHGNGRNVVLSGTVSSKDVVDRVVNVAMGFVDKKDDVVTLLQVREGRVSNQVLLKVRFAEVNRSALTQFGMTYFTSPTGVKNTLGRLTTQQYPSIGFKDQAWSKFSDNFGAPVAGAEGKFEYSDFLNLFLFSAKYDLGMMIKALQSRGLFQSLAEPNLVAESGKEASFLAGGEFPVPIVQGGGANGISISYKEYGIRLNFTPTVNGDRVHLKVRPEVSTLDFGNAVVLNGFRIPALSTRRAETSLELGNGQTFAVAGLMNNQVTTTLQKVPGIGDIPIIGHLFKSRAAQKDQTELVVMITPEILPTGSEGVTGQLPRTPESYLPPLPDPKTVASRRDRARERGAPSGRRARPHRGRGARDRRSRREDRSRGDQAPGRRAESRCQACRRGGASGRQAGAGGGEASGGRREADGARGARRAKRGGPEGSRNGAGRGWRAAGRRGGARPRRPSAAELEPGGPPTAGRWRRRGAGASRGRGQGTRARGRVAGAGAGREVARVDHRVWPR
jgi:pilus assembly protein CpaC